MHFVWALLLTHTDCLCQRQLREVESSPSMASSASAIGLSKSHDLVSIAASRNNAAALARSNAHTDWSLATCCINEVKKAQRRRLYASECLNCFMMHAFNEEVHLLSIFVPQVQTSSIFSFASCVPLIAEVAGWVWGYQDVYVKGHLFAYLSRQFLFQAKDLVRGEGIDAASWKLNPDFCNGYFE